MTSALQLHRYTAYFKGWCQAFGEHEAQFAEDESISWLYGEKQIGLILPAELGKQLFREVLSKKHKTPVLTLSGDGVSVGEFQHRFTQPHDQAGAGKLIQMLASDKEVHLFLTYHFMYQRGTRIITFSTEQPWPLIYKEIEPMRVELV
ncbi:MAG: hypothetical protein ACWGOW_04750 [Gammaproteobacteria bacterium]